VKSAQLTEGDRSLIGQVHAKQLTMCSPGKCYALAQACRQALADDIPGDVVLCGVWRGGLAIIAGSILMGSGRRVWLYDTFTGMTQPGARDGANAVAQYQKQKRIGHSLWCLSPMSEVLSNVASFGIPDEQIMVVAGDVAHTLTQAAPAAVAVAYLDTDFYDSTRAELETLYPRLSPGGFMFFDDYGYWPGCRAAVDEYFQGSDVQLQRVSDNCRFVVKA
jgi:O-methyltransferase